MQENRKYARKCLRGRRTIDVRAEMQAREYNSSGYARTKDWLMPTTDLASAGGRRLGQRWAPQKEVEGVHGRGGWKKWTGPAICQAAFDAAEQSGRVVAKCEGASQNHSRRCGLFTAGLIETRQDERDVDLARRSAQEPFRHYITNNMFDETQLYVAAQGLSLIHI